MNNKPYASVVGSIMDTMMCTWSNLSHVISVLSRFMENPGLAHWSALKRIMRYLRGVVNIGILF